MYARAKFLTFFATTVTVFSLTLMIGLAQSQLTNQSKLYINGIGLVKVGMTVAEASKAAGTRLVKESGYANESCFYVKPQNGLKVGFMVTEGRISRVDVYSNSHITTLSGAKISDTEARIKSLYPGQIQVTPHKYRPDGHYLTFIPKDKFDSNYRVVFETDGKRVSQFRSGELPEVEYVEGCA